MDKIGYEGASLHRKLLGRSNQRGWA